MNNEFHEMQDFSSRLLDHQQYFPNAQSIIKFIPNQQSITKKQKQLKKLGLSGWNDLNHEIKLNQHSKSYVPYHQNSQRIKADNFFYNLPNNNQFSNYKLRSKIIKKNKKINQQPSNYQTKQQIFLHMNNTIIVFPKSRNSSRKISNQERIALQNVYKKRQKSKITPKQIHIDPSLQKNQTLSSHYTKKDFVSKNRTFIHESHIDKVYNPESKTIQQIPELRKRFCTSNYKKMNGVFLGGDKLEKWLSNSKKSSIEDNLSNHSERFIRKQGNFNKDSKKKQNQFEMSPRKLYKTFYSSPKISSISRQTGNQFSILKIRQQAKNSHLNRIKNFDQKFGIQLVGSGITKWKFKAQQQLKNTRKQIINS